MNRDELIHITKLEAARRQLNTAVMLWFRDGDPVAIHTLLHAAHEIIHRLYRRSGHSDLLFDTKTIADADRKEFVKMLKADAAFFKHAERDNELDKIHEFHPGRNDLFMMISLFGLGRVVDRLTDAEWCAISWFLIQHPDWMTEEARNDGGLIKAFDKLRGTPKGEFLQSCALVRQEAERSQ